MQSIGKAKAATLAVEVAIPGGTRIAVRSQGLLTPEGAADLARRTHAALRCGKWTRAWLQLTEDELDLRRTLRSVGGTRRAAVVRVVKEDAGPAAVNGWAVIELHPVAERFGAGVGLEYQAA